MTTFDTSALGCDLERFDHEQIVLRFERWMPAAYATFLRTKLLPEHDVRYDEETDSYTVSAPARFARILGMEPPGRTRDWLELPGYLFDYQRHFVEVALAAKRYALWFDTGLGKTAAMWEWARQVQHRTGGRVLVVAPLNLIGQHLQELARFYGSDAPHVERLDSRVAMRNWCERGEPGLAITNPEKFLPRREESEITPEATYLAGIALDESSLLKTGGGSLKWALIKSCRGIEYKLSLTATPAPNDPIEYASQASWLEKIRDEGEVIWTYFVRDKDGEWKVKDHALAAFYRFLSAWSCYVRTPALFGFADNLKSLPAPERIEVAIDPTDEQLAELARTPDASGQVSLVDPEKLGIVERGRFAQVAAGFAYQHGGPARRIASDKPRIIAETVRREVAAGRQVIVWTLFDETVSILREELADAPFSVAVLTGSVPKESRAPIVESFTSGVERVLISRPEVLGFGANLQCCSAMVFADLNDSYEQVYQAERRAFRYGQTETVRIYFPRVVVLQDVVWQNLEAKRAQFERDVARMERLYVDALAERREIA